MRPSTIESMIQRASSVRHDVQDLWRRTEITKEQAEALIKGLRHWESMLEAEMDKAEAETAAR